MNKIELLKILNVESEDDIDLRAEGFRKCGNCQDYFLAEELGNYGDYKLCDHCAKFESAWAKTERSLNSWLDKQRH